MTTDSDEGEPRRGEKSLTERIIRAGAVAAALAAIIGLVNLVWPDSPARVLAELDDVEVDPNVTLTQFAERQRLAGTGPAAGTTSRRRQREQRVTLTRGHQQLHVTLIARSSQTPSPSPTPTESPSPTPTESPSPTPTESPTRVLDVGRLNEAVAFALPQARFLPPGCTSDDPGEVRCPRTGNFTPLINWLPAETVKAEGDDVVIGGDTLSAVFEQTRSRPISSTRTQGGTGPDLPSTEPVGVVVGFDLTLEGFQGRSVDVRWSLRNARAAGAVPHDWLANRLALRARAEAAFDRANGEFWVPLPKQKGRYFVHVSAWADETRLDSARTARFQ